LPNLSDKGLTTRIYRELKKLIPKRIKPLYKWANELNRQFPKVQMANKYMKKCSISLAIKNMSNQNDTEISPNSIQNGYHQYQNN
jgi:hypothetical protein